MRILSVGKMNGISNTCVHRNWALEKYADEVEIIDTYSSTSLRYRLCNRLFQNGLGLYLPDEANANKKIIEKIKQSLFDVVWIDKGLTIKSETLKYIKNRMPSCIIVSYSPDNMALRHNQSLQYLESLGYYDYLVTTKSYIVDDMKSKGAHKVIFVNNAFEERFHHPYELSENDIKELKADVAFVGTYERERCDSLLYLADHGIKVTVWGADKEWLKYKDYSQNFILHNHGLFSEDYPKSFRAAKISLCFLKKKNFDQQTTRTVEIPACGGFMVAERTAEHLAMFEEGKEAVFFSDNEELLKKCQYYLLHDNEREKIAENGYRRCHKDDYSNFGMIKRVFQQILNDR